MDSLEEQLAQLQILNTKPLSSKSIIDIGSSTYSSFDDGVIKDKNSKKVGPAVPPKPVKEMPQVPQSCIVRKTCEPLYSKRLQINNTTCQQNEDDVSNPHDCISNVQSLRSTSVSNTKTNLSNNPNKNLFYNDKEHSLNETQNRIENRIGKIPILLRKQPAYEQQHHVYSNIKMTLDNPAILDQQLEALEHHKKQLEKRGLLTSVNKVPTTGPKLSSASYINGELAAAARSSPSVKMMTAMIMENQQKSKLNNQEKLSKSPMADPNNQLSSSLISSKLNNITNSSTKDNNDIKGSENTIKKKITLKGINRLPPEQDIIYSNIMHSSSNNLIQSKFNLHGDKNIYSNVQFNPEASPPPPPPTINNGSRPSLLTCLSKSSEAGPSLDYFSNQQQQNSVTEEEFPLPPSPVSSSYSELRRATDNFPQTPTYPTQGFQNDLDSLTQSKENSYINTSYNDYSTYGGPSTQSFSQSSSTSDYYGFGSTCQGSSTYESIYEPITINPTNQMTSRSNFSLYTSYENDNTQNGSEARNMIDNISLTSSNNIHNSNKEIEVEKFTDMIVNSIDPGTDTDSYGSCVKCGERIVGENSGCTAMDQIYHISCFTCTQCQINLQGKPFYALENKPYCEEDYLNTLEKCSVCMKPILERILRATGKPYHPQCFTCVVCGNSLDGIPFTVDATNQNYCIQDFHKKFAPRCCVCREPIMPDPGQEETVRVVALDRSFHFECYKCEDCGLLLSSEAEGRGCYPLDDHVLCKSCNAKRVQALTNRMATEL